ncbi:MAG: penicillin-binding protein 2 [Deltaproteobacteria bacterium]|nr:penicillin-binding protein 2 [Deltaproteobacteria bacterium]
MNVSPVKWIKFRILCISLGFVAFLGLILHRSYQLQIAGSTRVDQLTSRQYKATLPISPRRGTIYDRNGKPLAVDIEVSSLAVHPRQITDAEGVVSALSAHLKIPTEKIREKLRSPKKFEWVIRRIARETGEAVASLKLKGVTVVSEYRRFYPNKDLAGNLLGAVGYEAESLGGIEMALDSYLKSDSTQVIAQKDARGRLFTPWENQVRSHDVYLTLDVNLQFIADRYLREGAEKHNAKSGFVIVMNPASGDILAMANYPSLNPNVYWKYSPEKWSNHAILDSYEPGSTFKPVVVASGLDSGKVRPGDSFDCEGGEYKIGKRTIHDHGAYGHLSVSEIIKVSSNIGVTKIAQRTGKNTFFETIRKMGFGTKPGIDLPGEASGSLRPLKQWSDIDLSNIAFGQGIAVSGLQMVQAYAVLANNGIRMKPQLVQRVVGSEGELVHEASPTEMARVMGPETAKRLTKMLEQVVEPDGTGGLAKLDGYAIAGKTGTAQKVDPKTKQYSNNAFVSSFIGYVPAEDPEFVIYVVYDTPKPVYYGGLVAAPVFKKIAEESLAYSGVAPSSSQLAKNE